MSQKRRTYIADFKFDAVMELPRGQKSVAQICRECGIRDNLPYKWRDAFLERAPGVFESANRPDVSTSIHDSAPVMTAHSAITMISSIL